MRPGGGAPVCGRKRGEGQRGHLVRAVGWGRPAGRLQAGRGRPAAVRGSAPLRCIPAAPPERGAHACQHSGSSECKCVCGQAQGCLRGRARAPACTTAQGAKASKRRAQCEARTRPLGGMQPLHCGALRSARRSRPREPARPATCAGMEYFERCRSVRAHARLTQRVEVSLQGPSCPGGPPCSTMGRAAVCLCVVRRWLQAQASCRRCSAASRCSCADAAGMHVGTSHTRGRQSWA
jgi:hypothetical protein